MTALMKHWSIDAAGRENLKLVESLIPTPGPAEILVRVAAVSLNYRDKLLVDDGFGLQRMVTPLTPGSDMAGKVIAVGSSVDRFQPGDRVISTFIPGWIDGVGPGSARQPTHGSLGGGYQGVLAEYVALNQEWAVKAPGGLSDVAASTLPCAGLTAWTGLVERGNLHSGQTVLVQGTGGVALFGAQIALAHGAETIVISGSDEKLARARELGVHHAINRNKHDWVEEIYRITGDRGVDHILEIVGGAHLDQSLRAAAVGGRISLIGVLEGFEISGGFASFAQKRLVVEGIQVGHRRALEDFAHAVEMNGIKPVVDAEYGLVDLPAALDHLTRGPFGKIVVTVN